MKRLKLWLKELSLTQQLITIIFIIVLSFALFFFVFLNNSVDTFVETEMYKSIHRSQNNMSFYLENGFMEYDEVADANIYHVVFYGDNYDSAFLINATNMDEGLYNDISKHVLEATNIPMEFSYESKNSVILYSVVKLDNSNGKAEVQAYIDGDWACQLDLLADSTNLPRNRNQPNTYKIIFDEPTYNIRFYAETYTTPTNDSNLGRICIGNLAYYEYDGLPISGYELEYNPSIWEGATMNNNCYAYALNNQVRPGTNTVWSMQQPGEYSGTNGYPFTKAILKNAVTQDFVEYNEDYGTNLIFKEVGKYSVNLSVIFKSVNKSYENLYF